MLVASINPVALGIAVAAMSVYSVVFFGIVRAKRKRLREAAGATALPPSEEHRLRGIAPPLIVLGLVFIWISIRLSVYSRSTSTWLVALGVLIGVLGVGQMIWGAVILIKRHSSDS